MAQFYNDIIEQKVNLLTLYLEEQDEHLNVMIGNIFTEYTKNGKVYSQEEFKKKFYNIYNLNFTKQELAIIEVFNEQNLKNVEEDEKLFLKLYPKQYVAVTNDNIIAFTKEFKLKILELESNSFFKYKNTIKQYDLLVAELWT